MIKRIKKGCLKDGRFWFTTAAIVTLSVLISLTVWQWKWLHSGTSANSETVRNIGFLIGGALALIFALWRAFVAERQANAAQGQTEAAKLQAEVARQQAEVARRQVETAQEQSEIARQTAQQQVETAQQSLLYERYRRSTDMLSNDVMSVRIGGVYDLQLLAEEHPEQYYIQVMRRFSDFVRNPPAEGEEPSNSGELRPDVQAVISAIGKRSEAGQRLEAEFRLDLRGAHLENADMWGLNLARADFSNARLAGATLISANLSNANLMSANLSGALLIRANFSNAILMNANLSGARLPEANFSRALLVNAIMSGAILGGEPMPANLDKAIHPEEYVPISQRQLDETVAHPNLPPNIFPHTIDPETGEPLVWRGRPLNPQS